MIYAFLLIEIKEKCKKQIFGTRLKPLFWAIKNNPMHKPIQKSFKTKMAQESASTITFSLSSSQNVANVTN